MLSTRLSILFTFVLTFATCNSLLQAKRYSNPNSDENTGNPLYLTSYVENGDIDGGRQLSRVGDLPDAPSIESYSGFITVKKEYNSNIFFWFFPALNKNNSAPVLLWLQGGPGLSGLLGLFVEHGPYIIHKNLTATLREYSWANTYQVLYVDNPVGAGYSFTEDMSGYASNQGDMADDMYEFLRQFFILFYEYKRNDFYIAGQSYGGKWVPSLANKIHSMGSTAVVQLKGIMVGNGFTDPESTVECYSEFMYNIGHIDAKQAKRIKSMTDTTVEEIKKEAYYNAHDEMMDVLSYFRKISGNEQTFNFLITRSPKDHDYYTKYIQHPQFKRAHRVGNLRYEGYNHLVRIILTGDFMKSAKENITTIMNNYKVLIYHGNLDIIVPYPAVMRYLNSINWKHADELKNSKRKIWHLKNSTEIAGYVHNVGDFYEVLIRNAGHEVPYDQPELAYDLISRFINDEPY